MLAFLILALTLSLAVPKVFAADMPMEPPIATLPPPSDTQGQTNLPDLPTLKETKNKKGDAILSWGNKLRKIEIQSLVPDSLSPEDKQIAYGYIQGYSLAINDPGAAKFHVSRALSGGYLPGVSIERNTAFLMGVKAALEQDLVLSKYWMIYEKRFGIALLTLARITGPSNSPPNVFTVHDQIGSKLLPLCPFYFCCYSKGRDCSAHFGESFILEFKEGIPIRRGSQVLRY